MVVQLNIASMSCSNCCELTGIGEWSEFNSRELKGEAVALSASASVNALLGLLRQAMDSVEYRLYGGDMSLSGHDAAELIDLQERAEKALSALRSDQHE